MLTVNPVDPVTMQSLLGPAENRKTIEAIASGQCPGAIVTLNTGKGPRPASGASESGASLTGVIFDFQFRFFIAARFHAKV
jgi:hypothetical protein